jgi:hypothetical protein
LIDHCVAPFAQGPATGNNPAPGPVCIQLQKILIASDVPNCGRPDGDTLPAREFAFQPPDAGFLANAVSRSESVIRLTTSGGPQPFHLAGSQTAILLSWLSARVAGLSRLGAPDNASRMRRRDLSRRWPGIRPDVSSLDFSQIGNRTFEGRILRSGMSVADL